MNGATCPECGQECERASDVFWHLHWDHRYEREEAYSIWVNAIDGEGTEATR